MIPEVDSVKVRYDILSGGGHVVLQLLVQAVVHHHQHLRVPGVPVALEEFADDLDTETKEEVDNLELAKGNGMLEINHSKRNIYVFI